MDPNENKPLSFDDEVTSASNINMLLRPGYGECVVTRVSRSYFNGSEKLSAGDMAVVQFDVTDEDGLTASVKTNFILNTALAWKITEFAKAIGELDPDAPDGEPFSLCWTDLVMRHCYCIIKNRTWVDSQGGEHVVNDISRFVFGGEADTAIDALGA